MEDEYAFVLDLKENVLSTYMKLDKAIESLIIKNSKLNTTFQKPIMEFPKLEPVNAIAGNNDLGVKSNKAKIDFNETAMAVERLASSFDPLIQKTVEYDEALADMMKTTNKTRSEAEQFVEQIAKIDTRTSKVDLMSIAEIGGQIGVTNEELLGFVKSIDKANVALSKDFGGSAEVVASSLGTIKNLYKETKDADYGTAMLQIASSTNALGDSGTATANNIAEFVTRMGQLGDIGPGLKENLAIGAILEESGIKAEIASGGLSNLFLVAGRESEKFANTLGITNEQFNQLYNNDPSGLILKLSERLKGMSEVEIAKLFDELKIGSQESIKVFQALASNTDKFKEKIGIVEQQFKTMSSIEGEYNTKNSTLGAQLQKTQKYFDAWAVSLGAGLAPYLPIIQSTGSLAVVASSLGSLLPVLKTLFSAIISPIGLVVAAILAVVAGLYYFYQNSTFVKGVLTEIFDKISSVGLYLFAQFNKILQAFGIELSGTTDWLGILYKAFEFLFSGISLLLLHVVDGAIFWIKIITNAIVANISFWVNMFRGFYALFTGDWQSALTFFGKAFSGLKDYLFAQMGAVAEYFESLIGVFIKGAEMVGLVKTGLLNKTPNKSTMSQLGAGILIKNQGVDVAKKEDLSLGAKDIDKALSLTKDIDGSDIVDSGSGFVNEKGSQTNNFIVNELNLIRENHITEVEAGNGETLKERLVALLMEVINSSQKTFV